MQEETLNIFRVYRDSYLANSRFGRSAITRYYRLAPSIVRAIEGRQDAELIWGNVWRRYLAPAVMAIRLNKKREAYYLYSRMVSDLARLAGLRDFTPSDKFDGYDCLA